MRKTLLALAVLAAIPAMVMAWPQPGETAPNISLPDTAGVNQQLITYNGKVVLLFFWQSS
jgi:hypothetical protein